MPVCSQRFPGRTELGGGHWTNCFLYGDGDGDAADVHATQAAVKTAPAS
jgi:peptide/nickel transport system ATP-binding protein